MEVGFRVKAGGARISSVTGTATQKEKITVNICDERSGGCQLIEVDQPIDR